MNKKLLTIFSCGALLLTLSGCGEAKTEPSDQDAWLIKMGDEEVTKKDVYNEMVAQNNIDPVVNKINSILTSKVVKTDKSIKDEANNQLNQLKSALGDNFEKTIKAQGYKNEKEYLNKVIIPGVKLSKIPEAYFKEQYDELANDYKLRKMQVVYINDKKTADKAKKDLKAGKKFNEIANKYGNKEAMDTSVNVYATKDSNIPKKVLDKALELKNGKNTGVVSTGVNKSYMIIKMVEKDPKKFKKDGVKYFSDLAKQQDQAAAAAAQNSQNANDVKADTKGELTNKAYTYYLEKYDFSAHDVDIYQALLTSSDKYKVK